jgi:lysozyme family protein
MFDVAMTWMVSATAATSSVAQRGAGDGSADATTATAAAGASVGAEGGVTTGASVLEEGPAPAQATSVRQVIRIETVRIVLDIRQAPQRTPTPRRCHLVATLSVGRLGKMSNR